MQSWLNTSVKVGDNFCAVKIVNLWIRAISCAISPSAFLFVIAWFILFLFTFQVIISVISLYLDTPDTKLQMPVPSKKLVELSCVLPIRAPILPVTFNLLLIVSRAVHGFLTKSLPENFNESYYIFVSVSTTTFLWVVFLQTYFSTF